MRSSIRERRCLRRTRRRALSRLHRRPREHLKSLSRSCLRMFVPAPPASFSPDTFHFAPSLCFENRQSSPQPQRPFAFSPSASLSSSLGGSTSGYPASPLSTPSRTMQYSTISTPGSSLASSTSTVGYTPSPSVGYRGRGGLTGSIGSEWSLDGLVGELVC